MLSFFVPNLRFSFVVNDLYICDYKSVNKGKYGGLTMFNGMNGNMYGYYNQQQNNAYITTDDRIWIQGEGAALAYLVAPNSFVRLWDSQSPVFYEKRTDPSGRPYMETYEYKKRTDPEPDKNNDLIERITSIETRIANLEKGTGNDGK